jgi:DNA invertase Pin-like site-specific DNA recombinase
MRVGYARVSTTEQNMEAQLERLADCDKIFAEKQSGKMADRPQLAAALEYVREGDTLVATRLDRLARSVAHLCDIAEMLRRKGVELEIIDQKIDTSTATGKLLFHMLAAIAEFELSIRMEAQRAGMAHARSLGHMAGRKPKLTQEQVCEALDRRMAGDRAEKLSTEFGVALPTMYRYMALEIKRRQTLEEMGFESSKEMAISSIS